MVAETSEMVERVAKAISGAPFPSRAAYRKAEAAIRAMREPTEAMRYAVWADQYEFNGGSPAEVRALATKRMEDASQREQDMQSWAAAIDVALTAPAASR